MMAQKGARSAACGRRTVVRGAIAVAYVALAACMFVTGRSHTVLVDNRAAEDGSYAAIRGMTVTVNRNPPSEFMRGDRDKFTIKGQSLKIHVESFDGSLDETYVLRVPLGEDAVLVSIPKLAAGYAAADAVERFDVN